jgi:hypothetical protein
MAPLSFYEDKTPLESSFKLEGNTVSFQFPEGYDTHKAIVVDPWIIPLTTLLGAAGVSNKGYDIDFDFDGNLYAYGGGGDGGGPASDTRLPNTP